MIFKKSLFDVLLRVVILAIFIAGALYNYLQTDYVVGPIMFMVLTILSMTEMVWYLQRLQRNWSQFLLSIKHQDFNRNYHHGSEHKELFEAYDLISSSFEKLKQEKHADHRLLQTVLGHIPVGLCCIDSLGNIVFENKALKTLIGLELIRNISTLELEFSALHEAITNNESLSGIVINGKAGQRILLKTDSFSLKGTPYKLVSITDIKSTLDTHELNSYQQLMRVMTHEIMNSATPVLALVQVVNAKLVGGEMLNKLDDKAQKNIAISLKAIETRTQGILKFVESYRKINRDFSPIEESVNPQTLIDQLMPMTQKSNISVAIENNIEHDIRIDVNLMSQVLINLMQNAADALKGTQNPAINITFNQSDNEFQFIIKDNGPGVHPENTSNIFIPFFTTKTDGSGIGLALSRKIIKAHGGILSYQRLDDGWTQFCISIPKHKISHATTITQ